MVEIATWRPYGNDVSQQMRRFFTGGAPELEDISYVKIPTESEVQIVRHLFRGECSFVFGICTYDLVYRLVTSMSSSESEVQIVCHRFRGGNALSYLAFVHMILFTD